MVGSGTIWDWLTDKDSYRLLATLVEHPSRCELGQVAQPKCGMLLALLKAAKEQWDHGEASSSAFEAFGSTA